MSKYEIAPALYSAGAIFFVLLCALGVFVVKTPTHYIFEITASPNSLVFTSVAPSISRAKS